MDVRCDRCQTDYELDDDIVTEAGASVQCTTCGHTFFVRPGGITGVIPKGGGDFSAPEAPGWTLRTEDGKVHRFRDFTTLQRWIVERKVTRHDRVSRASGPWQALGDIGDLAPFFAVVEEADVARIATSISTSTSISVSPSPPATAGAGPVAPPTDVSQRMPGVTAPSLSGLTAAGTSEASRDPRIPEDGPTVPNRRLPSPADGSGSVAAGASGLAATAPANDGRIGGGGSSPITAPGSPGVRVRRPPQDLPPPPAAPMETAELVPARSGSRWIAWAVVVVLVGAGAYWWWSERGGGAASSAGQGEAPPAVSPGTERAAEEPAGPTPTPAPTPTPTPTPASAAMVAADSVPTDAAPSSDTPAPDGGAPGEPSSVTAARSPVAPTRTAVAAHRGAGSLAPAAAVASPGAIAGKRGDRSRSAVAAGLPGAPSSSYERLVADGDRALERGGAARADQLYAQALVVRPDGIGALTGSGYVLLARQRHFQAIATFRRALAIDPTYGRALFGIAESYRARGDASQALVAYRQYLALSPAGADAPAARRQIKDLSSDDEPGTSPP